MTRPTWILVALLTLAVLVAAAHCSVGLRFEHDPPAHID